MSHSTRSSQYAATIASAAANPKKLLFVHAACGVEVIEIYFGTGDNFYTSVYAVIDALEGNQKVVAHVLDLPSHLLEELIVAVCHMSELHHWQPARAEQFESVPADLGDDGEMSVGVTAADRERIGGADAHASGAQQALDEVLRDDADQVEALLQGMKHQHAKEIDATQTVPAFPPATQQALDELNGTQTTMNWGDDGGPTDENEDADPLPQDRKTLLLAHADCDKVDIAQIGISSTDFVSGAALALQLLRGNKQVLVDVSEISEDQISVLLEAVLSQAEAHHWTLGYESTYGGVLVHHGERLVPEQPTPGRFFSEFLDEVLSPEDISFEWQEAEQQEAERATVAIENDASSRINSVTAVCAAMHGAGIATALALDPTLKYDKEELSVLVCKALLQNQHEVAEIFDIADQAIVDIDEALSESVAPGVMHGVVEVDHGTDGLDLAELDQKQLDREDAVQTFDGSIDAILWARAFMADLAEPAGPIDEGLMTAWFANAIYSGVDSGRAHEKRLAELAARERIEAAIGDEVHH